MKAFYFPGLLVSQILADPTLALYYVGTEQHNGQNMVHVRVRREIPGIVFPGTDEDWYFDPVTSLPLRFRYKIASEASIWLYFDGEVDYGSPAQFGSVISPSIVTL